MNEPFIIKVKYGGLGDHLFWSHLPRIAKTVGGYQRVYISNHSNFRHSDYRKLIWELNPYVDGFCDEDGPYPDSLAGENMNLLDQVMLARNLDDGKRFHEPEIYYKPKIKLDLKSAFVFDPNYVSYVGEISNQKISAYLNKAGGVNYQMRLRGKGYGILKDVAVLDTSDIFEYCDIIASCKNFYCLSSGGATLASALGKSAIVFYGVGQNDIFRHSHLNQYVDASVNFSAFWVLKRQGQQLLNAALVKLGGMLNDHRETPRRPG